VIAAVTSIILSLLYYKWQKSVPRNYFIGLLLVGSFNLWFLPISLVILPAIRNIPFYFSWLVAANTDIYSVWVLPAIIYLLSKYAYTPKSKEQYLIYATVIIQSLISAGTIFIKNFLFTAQIQTPSHPSTSLFLIAGTLFVCGLALLCYLLENPVHRIAKSNNRKHYKNLYLMFIHFFSLWLTILTYIYTYKYKHLTQTIALDPLFMKYIIIVLPNLFLATFSIYYLYAMHCTKVENSY